MTPAMKGQHLYRYIKGQISTPRPKSSLAANLQGAVDVLEDIDVFSWASAIPNKTMSALGKTTIFLLHEEKRDRIKTLVALTALAFLTGADFTSLNRLTLYNTQALPQSWAMMTAVFMNDKQTVEALLASLSTESRLFHLSDPLRMAVKISNADTARLLLANGASVNMYPIYYNPGMGYRMVLDDACLAGDLDMVELLLEPQYCVQTDSEEYEMTIRLMVEKVARNPDSLEACKLIIRKLVLSAIPDVRLPLLHYLVDRSIVNHTGELISLAIEMGFDVNQKGHDSQSPLVHAVNSGDFQIATTLVAHGARPMHKQDYDAVREACRFGRVNMLEMLLRKSITVDEYGHALAGGILLVAAQSSKYGEDVYLQLMQCFCDHGLDPNAANWGLRALDLAIERDQRAIVAYLIGKGVVDVDQLGRASAEHSPSG